jgi:hypothetical protein
VYQQLQWLLLPLVLVVAQLLLERHLKRDLSRTLTLT